MPTATACSLNSCLHSRKQGRMSILTSQSQGSTPNKRMAASSTILTAACTKWNWLQPSITHQPLVCHQTTYWTRCSFHTHDKKTSRYKIQKLHVRIKSFAPLTSNVGHISTYWLDVLAYMSLVTYMAVTRYRHSIISRWIYIEKKLYIH